MSTRGVIAVAENDNPLTFSGRYHHWDSYPLGLGKTLWDLYQTTYYGNFDALKKDLIEDHPLGWSSINDNNMTCYCHSRKEVGEQIVTHLNAAKIGCEYAYILGEHEMIILSSYSGDTKMIGMFGAGDKTAVWKLIGMVPWKEPEPNWTTFI